MNEKKFSPAFWFKQYRYTAESMVRIDHMTTNHEWEDDSDPEERSGNLITSRIGMRCSVCGIQAGVFQLREEDRDCDVVLVRDIMES